MISKSKIKQIVSLNRKKYRDEQSLFVAEGIKTISELIAANFSINYIICTPLLAKELPRVTCEILIADVDEMKKVSLFSTPSQILAVCQKPLVHFDPHMAKTQLVLALDGIQDPGNLGTLIRLSSWFGINNMLCSPDSADCYNPKAVQASMGALAHVAIHYTELANWLNDAKSNGIPVYGTFLDGTNIYTEELSGNGIVLMGNEGQGIRPENEAHVTHKLFIPSFPKNKLRVESLNVSSAASIIISEFRRAALK